MTETAPERIWTDYRIGLYGHSVSHVPSKGWDIDPTEYIRADHANALVAAALAEGCVECAGTGLRDSGGSHPWGEAIMLPCDHNAPPDAQAALTAQLAAAEARGRKAGLREALEAVSGVAHGHHEGSPADEALLEAHQAIEALIEKETS